MSVADQLVAAVQEVDLMCGGNAHLVNDEIISELVEFAANGRHTDAFDLVIGDPFEARVRVLPAHVEASARFPHEPAVPTGRKGCDRCGIPYGPSAERTVPEWWDDGYGKRDGTRSTCWVPAGSAVVELVLCVECVDYLNASFGPVEWR